jgi:plasmid stabilization system protein ParE
MRLTFHPSVASDIARVMSHYQQVAGALLADEFYAELRSCFVKALENPLIYPIHSGDLRRVSLDRFPYHFLFRIAGEDVRVLVVRHHRRRPTLGTARR